MRRIYTLLISVACVCTSVAQPRLVCENARQKVGEIIFMSPKTVKFEFQNKGTQPLVITEVHPSCGCISVKYPESAIAAGQSGIIEATYDARMLGTFYRELAVFTNEQEAPTYLAFEGRVVERLLDYDGDFPIDLGNVRLSSNYVEFDDVNRGDRPVVELQVANLEHGTYEPQLMHLPQYLSAEYLPPVVQSGRIGRIRLTLDSERLMMDGLNQTSIYLARYMGDKISDKNEIVVSAILLPAFRDLTADGLARAPHIVVMDGTEMVEDVAQVPMNDKKKVTKILNVTNIGEETLSISSVQVFNRALSVSLSDRNIAPHATAKLKITIDAKQLAKAKNGPRLLIISNDPRHAKTLLDLNVE